MTSNQSRSLGKLRKLLRNLQKNKKLFELYGQLIQEQLAEGVIERVTEEENFGQREFYLPHKTVIRDNAKSTNLRIVYDMSARENIRSIVNEQLFGDKSCPSKLPMECINQKKIQPKSSVWRSLKGIPSNKNQDRRLWCSKISLDQRKRSASDWNSSIYKACILTGTIFIYLRWNFTRTFRNLHSEVPYWSCWNKRWSICRRSEFWWK